MKHRIFALLFVAALLLVANPSISLAQNVTFITTDFPFVVQGKTVPAGTYVLRLKPDMTEFTLTQSDSPAPAGATAVTTMTRLGGAQPPKGNSRVVFDKAGDSFYLSEIWLPDQDGWLVHAASGKHTHRVVEGKSKIQ